jgi:hypothetical protein
MKASQTGTSGMHVRAAAASVAKHRRQFVDDQAHVEATCLALDNGADCRGGAERVDTLKRDGIFLISDRPGTAVVKKGEAPTWSLLATITPG